MPSDVHEIAETEQQRMREQQPTGAAAATTNLLVAPGANAGTENRVNIDSQHNSVEIRNDHPDKRLKEVKKHRK